MRQRLAAVGLVLLGGLAAVLWGQCFVPTYHDCAFQCGPTPPQCPAEYECRSDNYCHLLNSPPDGFCVAPDQGPPVGDAGGGGG